MLKPRNGREAGPVVARNVKFGPLPEANVGGEPIAEGKPGWRSGRQFPLDETKKSAKKEAVQ